MLWVVIFELLDKENDLSFDLSLLDCILLNEDSNLDSVEATISLLIDEIKNRESEHTKASKRESKQKGNLRFAAPLSTKQIEYLSTKWATCILSDWCNEINGCPSALLDCPTHLFKHVKVTDGLEDTTMAIPCQHWTLANSICHQGL